MNVDSTIYLNDVNVKIIKKALNRTKNDVLKTVLKDIPDRQAERCIKDTKRKIDYYLKCR